MTACSRSPVTAAERTPGATSSRPRRAAPEEATHALFEIGKLYEIERILREQSATAEERCAARQELALPVLDGLKAWLESQNVLPKSPWGKAVGYALNHWAKLTRYTEDGRIEINNNLVENAIRPIALRRKNYLFAGSHAAARRASVICSLLATCKNTTSTHVSGSPTY